MQINTVSCSSDFINRAHADKQIEYAPLWVPDINSCSLFQSDINPKHSAILRYLGNNQWTRIATNKQLAFQRFEPKDAAQAAFMDCLLDTKILIAAATGTAGTGKTTLAMAYAAQMYVNENKPIYLSKPTAMVGTGSAFGPVPGDIGEKYAPYLDSYNIVLKKVFGESSEGHYMERMRKKEHLKFIPVELARGCTYENCTFILDEAQNLTWHEMNTIVSRMGENTKMIILGDPYQIDVKLRREETGLHTLLNSPPYRQSPITSAIQLKTQYRSEITKLVAEVNKWVTNEKAGYSSTN